MKAVIHNGLLARMATADPGPVKPICINGNDSTEITIYAVDGKILGVEVWDGEKIAASWGLHQ